LGDRSSLNIYSPVDIAPGNLPSAERIFLSHRSFDKPLAVAVGALLEGLGVHYWLDRDDEDTRRAVELGMAGDQAVVHAIERGVRHSSCMLGLLSGATRGSWWVPYEIGISRALDRPVSFLVLASIQTMEALPEYVRLAANYWSVDELVRWATGLVGRELNAPAVSVAEQLVTPLMQFVPRHPPAVTVRSLSARALAAIERLSHPKTWEALQLTSTEKFDWLPSRGGLVREIAYDILAPLAFFQLNDAPLAHHERHLLGLAYRSVTLHYELAELEPQVIYHPEVAGWRERRYHEQASSWLQGLSSEQLTERLNRFLLVQDIDRNRRLATREEFKAEFDRIERGDKDHERRALGVLINPLLGFTPTERPVYLRVLALQQRLYQALANSAARAIFDEATNSVVDHVLDREARLRSQTS
jgi:hypothetical protein